MANNSEPDGQGLADQSAYPGLHRNFMCEELSIGTYVWRVKPHASVAPTQDQSHRLDTDLTDQLVASGV